MAWQTVIALVLLLTAGCTSTTSAPRTYTAAEPSVEPSMGGDGPWVVWVHGGEDRAHVAGPPGAQYVCSILFDHEIDAAARTLRYANATYAFDPASARVIVVLDHWETHSDCPIDYRLVPDPAGPVEVDLGRGGHASLSVDVDGTLTVDGNRVSFGEALEVAYEVEERDAATTYHYTGQVLFENLGHWPASAFDAA